MPKSLIDTNLIIRFLVNDDLQKAARVKKILQESKVANILPDLVIAEIIWVLSSYYELEKASIINKIRALIHVKTIECNKTLMDQSLTNWEKYNISFVDAYLVSVAKLKGLNIYSYDFKFDKVDGVTRQEP